MSAAADKRAVVWLPLAGGRRRAVEVAIDPAQLDQALAKWHQLLGPTPDLHVSVYPARPDAGPPNPVSGLPDLQDDPARALADHLVGHHRLSGETAAWLGEYEGLVGLVGEHDLDHAEHPSGQLGHTPPHPMVTNATGTIAATHHGLIASSGAGPGLQISHQISLQLITWRPPPTPPRWPQRLSGGPMPPRLVSLFDLPTPLAALFAAGPAWRPGPPGDVSAQSGLHSRDHPHPGWGWWR